MAFLKENWKDYLHRIKRKEVEIAFQDFRGGHFSNGLELGCGDGYQSQFIKKYCDNLIAGDFNFDRIKKEFNDGTVAYLKCDAERLGEYFDSDSFDLIFSSSMVEHLRDRKSFLEGASKVLNKDGVLIHIVPNRVWKFLHYSLFYPNLFIIAMDRIFKRQENNESKAVNNENNLKLRREKRSPFFDYPHGHYRGHLEEFYKFGKSQWKNLFNTNGLRVVKVLRGPFCAGYGFKLGGIEGYPGEDEYLRDVYFYRS